VHHDSVQAVDFHLQYHRANPKKNTIKTCEFVLTRFTTRFDNRDLASISQEEVLDFLLSLTKNNKQATKKKPILGTRIFLQFQHQYRLARSHQSLQHGRDQKIFKHPQAIQWNIDDKETVDEIIFRTMNTRNRLMLELMARGGMRVGEVLNFRPADIQERSLAIQNPKSGRVGEIVYIPRKLLVRLNNYIEVNNLNIKDRIFPISYVAA
jgi:integrase/recombinase XerD